MIVQLIYFGVLFWFALYIMNRDVSNRRLLLTGIGLLIYSVGLASELVLPFADDVRINSALRKIQDIAFYLPLLSWQGVLILSRTYVDEHKQSSVRSLWKYVFIVPVLLCTIVLLFLPNASVYDIFYEAIIGIILLLLLVFTVWGADSSGSAGVGQLVRYLPLFFYTCFTILTLAMPEGSWKMWAFTANSFGLLLFAVSTLIAEVKQQGESWLPDFFRSFDYSLFFTLLFSGQVALVIVWGGGFTLTMMMFMLISICVSIAFQVFVYPIRAVLDSIAFATFPKLRHDRSKLRLLETVQVRLDVEAATEEIEEEDLFRYTRRALSHFGDLQRLAASPLTRLDIINRRVKERGAADEMLERAIELKTFLLESIMQLKPRGEEDFGTTDEWRYYNALYFPYIIGIKPYSLRYSADHLDTASQEALSWFRTYVPERTFYNWQNAGAKLVSMNLKQKNIDRGQAG